MILEARDLTVRYAPARPPALDAVSCHVAATELVAVVGPNGSGKTTLVRALSGLIAPERGTVRIHDRPLASWSRSELARVLGVVPQREDILFPLRVEEAVLLGRYARLGPLGAPGPADHAAVSAALDRCDARGLVGRSIDSLSGGEWQRVRLARALAQEPTARWRASSSRIISTSRRASPTGSSSSAKVAWSPKARRSTCCVRTR